VTKGKKVGVGVAAGVSAAAVAIGGGIAKFGDDASRAARGSHPTEIRIPEVPTPGPVIRPTATSFPEVGTSIDDGATSLERDFGVDSVAAHEAMTSIACDVVETSLTNLVTPTPFEWEEILINALGAAFVEDVPTGSQAWYNLEQLKSNVEAAIEDPFTGEVDQPDAQALASDIGCDLIAG
jgi:hypothetical protein